VNVLFISAHLDDAQAAAGGTIVRLLRDGADPTYLGLSLCEESVPVGFPSNVLAQECVESSGVLGMLRENLIIKNFPVRHFPEQRQGILDEFIRLRDSLRPDIVLVPSTSDLHQDHAVVSQEALRAFRRSASMFGYDFPWNVLQTAPLQFFVELEEADLFRKIRALQSYKSQLAKPNNCLTEEYVRALAIERGNRIGRRYAEAFEVLREVRSRGQQVF